MKWSSPHISGARKGTVERSAIVSFAKAVGWELLSLTPAHASASLASPAPHKDPFDELLLIQAQEEGLRLLTRDARLIPHCLAVPDGIA